MVTPKTRFSQERGYAHSYTLYLMPDEYEALKAIAKRSGLGGARFLEGLVREVIAEHNNGKGTT